MVLLLFTRFNRVFKTVLAKYNFGHRLPLNFYVLLMDYHPMMKPWTYIICRSMVSSLSPMLHRNVSPW